MAGEITLAELARMFASTSARLEAKLDELVERNKDLADRDKDHEMRIRSVERYIWIAVGISATGATSGFVALIRAFSGS